MTNVFSVIRVNSLYIFRFRSFLIRTQLKFLVYDCFKVDGILQNDYSIHWIYLNMILDSSSVIIEYNIL